MVNTLSQNWWTLVLRGLAAVLFGIWAFVWPDITFTVLVLLFGAYALWDGVFALIGAFRTQGEQRWMLDPGRAGRCCHRSGHISLAGRGYACIAYHHCGLGNHNGHLRDHRRHPFAGGDRRRVVHDAQRFAFRVVWHCPCRLARCGIGGGHMDDRRVCHHIRHIAHPAGLPTA